jgi:hypothetical protein
LFVVDAVAKERAAYKRLKEHADHLRTLDLRGTVIVIGKDYGVGTDGTLCIKHDFTIEEIKTLLLPSQTPAS